MNNNWIEENNCLTKTYKFVDFISAIAWMAKVAPKIDALGHHPEWTNVYNRISVKLTTHDANSTVTAKDWELSKLLDSI